jgi:hypothetical protein
MTPQLIAVIIDNLITILGGAVAMLIGFRIFGPKPTTNPKFDAFYNSYGKHLKWLGPVLIVFALINIGIYFYENP